MFPVCDNVLELKKIANGFSLFDTYRLIAPHTHTVCKLVNGVPVATNLPECYTIWNRETPCDNCISRRCCDEQKRFVKIENMEGKIYLVVAHPIVIQGAPYSLELAIDATDSVMATDNVQRDHIEITQVIRRINEFAIRDDLSGLYNNHFIKNKVDSLIEQKGQKSLSFAVFDIDYFKQVNDQHGHLIGDYVIGKVSDVLRKFNSKKDCFAARMGGDEFALIFYGYGCAKANALCTAAAKEISEHTFHKKKETFHVTVSFGVVEHQNGESSYDFIDRADLCMYENKRHARKSMPIKIPLLPDMNWKEEGK